MQQRDPASQVSTHELVARVARPAAVGAVTLTITAILALTTDRGLLLGLIGTVAVVGGIALDRRAGRPTASGSAALVAGVVLIFASLRDVIAVDLVSLDPFLLTSAAVVSILAFVLQERRFSTLAVLQVAIVVGRPVGSGFSHCLIARSVVVPTPRLDGLLLLGIVAVIAGLASRRLGATEAGRGYQISGLAITLLALLAKATELPGLEVLCGRGDATDDGWIIVAFAAGAATVVAGLRWHDLTVLVLGAATYGLTGFSGTLLDGHARWSIIGAVPFVIALVAADRLGVPWPPHRVAAPGTTRSLDLDPPSEHERD